jgi:2,3-dihydroxy-2,3-dihydrophenylpropionate dehydrogenase
VTGRLSSVAAVVTGGGSGIGRGVVEAYLREGAQVQVVERSERAAAALRAAHPERLDVVVGDATDADVVGEAILAAQRTGRPHAQLTCCVGVFDGYATVRELTPDKLVSAGQEIWTTNVLGALLAVDVAWQWLRDRCGSATLTLSESAFHPIGGGVLYGATKWALRGAVAHLATDLAPQVRVNGVAPGGTTGTRFSATGTLGAAVPADEVAGRDERIRAGNALGVVPSPADHAGAYLYLADPDAARVVTGVIINTDGGRR